MCASVSVCILMILTKVYKEPIMTLYCRSDGISGINSEVTMPLHK